MGWGGRSLVLLCFATLLLISASAVSGNIHVEELRRFGRFGRDNVKDVATEDSVVAEKVFEAVSLDEKKPAEGILEKARSFLSGLSNPTGNGVVSHHLSSLSEKKKMARAEEEEKSDVQRHSFGRHHGFSHLHWAGIRDMIRNHPERLAHIAATEPNVYEKDGTSISAFQAKLNAVVRTALGEYKYGNLPVTESRETTCAGVLEDQVKILVKSVKSELREQLCNGDVASREEQRFCNVFNNHPMMATLEVFAKTSINPINLLTRQTTAMAACSSVNPFTEYMDSLNEMEGLALKALLSPEVGDNLDVHMEHDREHLMFHKHRHAHENHEDHERHWWQWMLPKQHLHFDEEHHKEDKHELHHEWKQGEHGLEQKEHEKHWWHRMFPMFHEHKRHRGFEHAQIKFGKDCYSRSVRHLYKSIRNHLATTCQTATSPNVISACMFGKEHRFLVKTWLAVKIPVWSEAAKKCASTRESLPVSSEEMIRVAPDLPELALSEAAHSAVDAIFPMKTVPHNIEGMMQHWISRSCARKLANPALSKALYQRGHVIGMSRSNDGLGLPGLIRTHLVVLREHPRPHHHVGEEAVDISELLDRLSSGDMLSKIQDRLEALKDAASSEPQTVPAMAEKTSFNSFQHHPKGLQWMHRNFRISANPRVLPTSEGLHFRISAKRRPVAVSSIGTSTALGTSRLFAPMLEEGNVEDGGETESTGIADSEVELRMKTAKDTTENRADM